MSLIRSGARNFLQRWREVAFALASALFGAWVALRGGWFYGTVGLLVTAFALGLALSAWRRLRFARAADAPGIVELDEGAIAYFGPETGGVVALSELSAVFAVVESSGLVWRLHQNDGRSLSIPAAARGAEQLFDVFGALPGASTEVFLSAMRNPPDGERRLWQRQRDTGEARLPPP